MTSLACLAQTLQTLWTTTADRLATSTGCIQRHRKLSGATLVQILVLGWLQQPAATCHQLAQMAATEGVAITPQGIAHRFTEATATVRKQVLDAAVTQLLASEPVAIALLRRFPAVMIQDSSLVVLPTPVATTWRGCGTADPQTGAAAVKLQVRLDLVTGALQGPVLQDGRVHALTAPAHTLKCTGASTVPGKTCRSEHSISSVAHGRPTLGGSGLLQSSNPPPPEPAGGVLAEAVASGDGRP